MNTEQNACKTKCDSCLMPFSNDKGIRESPNYCSLCYKDGKLCYEGNDLKEFQEIVYASMLKNGMNKYKAKFYTWCIRFAPRWKNSK